MRQLHPCPGQHATQAHRADKRGGHRPQRPPALLCGPQADRDHGEQVIHAQKRMREAAGETGRRVAGVRVCRARKQAKGSLDERARKEDRIHCKLSTFKISSASHLIFTCTSSSPSGSVTCTAQAMQVSKEWMVRRISIGCFGSCMTWLSCSAASLAPGWPCVSRGPAVQVLGTTAW